MKILVVLFLSLVTSYAQPIFGGGGVGTITGTSSTNVWVLNPTNYVHQLDPITISNAYNPNINVTNLSLGTNYVYQMQPVTVSNTVSSVSVTNGSIVSTNYAWSITGANVVTNCAWSITNELARVNGGSGIIQSITMIGTTNRDFVLWIFDKVVTAPTAGSAWTPALSELQYLVQRVATTNASYGDWNRAGTNYAKTLNSLAIPFQNADGSKNVHIIATAQDTKADPGTNLVVTISSLND